MANSHHLEILKQGKKSWDVWRTNYPHDRPNLNGANLSGIRVRGIDLSFAKLNSAQLAYADLREASLRGASLSGANLRNVSLREADLSEAIFDRAIMSDADLSGADLNCTVLNGADLTRANLAFANLAGAHIIRAVLKGVDLTEANLSDAVLRGADLNGAKVTRLILNDTVFADINLSGAFGLTDCRHLGPSVIDHRTLQKSGELPIPFLQGCGLPDKFIWNIKDIFSTSQCFCSVFLSYSHEDEEFASKLYSDFQGHGVRCWYAPEHLKIGDKIRDRIEEEISRRDKLLVILSSNSIDSGWVSSEVEAAMHREGREMSVILFPVCLDDGVTETDRSWVKEVLRTRHVGNFTRWQDPNHYNKAFSKLLADLISSISIE